MRSAGGVNRSTRPSSNCSIRASGTLRARSNGLGRLGGGWSEKEFRDFERATAQFEEVDEELWRVTSYCLDTSAYSNFRRGNERSWRRFSIGPKPVGVPTIALGELRTGFLLGRRREQNEAELATFLDHPAVQIFRGRCRGQSALRRNRRRPPQGRDPGSNQRHLDRRVAARNGTAVLTCDEHFETDRARRRGRRQPLSSGPVGSFLPPSLKATTRAPISPSSSEAVRAAPPIVASTYWVPSIE